MIDPKKKGLQRLFLCTYPEKARKNYYFKENFTKIGCKIKNKIVECFHFIFGKRVKIRSDQITPKGVVISRFALFYHMILHL